MFQSWDVVPYVLEGGRHVELFQYVSPQRGSQFAVPNARADILQHFRTRLRIWLLTLTDITRTHNKVVARQRCTKDR